MSNQAKPTPSTKPFKGNRRYTDAAIALMRTAFKEGKSLKEIAEIHQCSITTVYNYTAGMKSSQRIGRGSKFTVEQIATIKRLFIKGEHWQQLAETFKCSGPTIYKICKDVNRGPDFVDRRVRYSDKTKQTMQVLCNSGMSKEKVAIVFNCSTSVIYDACSD